ncbi:hypothetical protein TWF718_001704 [Orbilia javanica]|uniref:Uncharacterized protein n=1 Tax=Orbilia javanica TaxID=47235 RepID=A0AAN8N907_9PEZI
MSKELCEFSVLERSATTEVRIIFGSFPKEPSALKAWSIFVDNLWEPVGKRFVTWHPPTARRTPSKQESDFERHDATIDKIARPVATSDHHSGKAEVGYVSRLKICFLITTRDSRWNVSRRAWSHTDVNLKLELHARVTLALKSNWRFAERDGAAVYRSGDGFTGSSELTFRINHMPQGNNIFPMG